VLCDDAPAFHDHSDVLLGVGEKADILQRVTPHRDEVRHETRFHLTQLLLHPNEPCADYGGAAKEILRRNEIGAKVEFLGLAAM
jgi:hypothetical protein